MRQPLRTMRAHDLRRSLTTEFLEGMTEPISIVVGRGEGRRVAVIRPTKVKKNSCAASQSERYPEGYRLGNAD